MEFLSFQQIQENKGAIQNAFELLMASKALVNRPSAKQWRFFRSCAAVLFAVETPEQGFEELLKTTAAQYKFEVEYKLSRFYMRPGKHHDFVFAMVHRNHLQLFDLWGEYPCFGNYSILVRDGRRAQDTFATDRSNLSAFLEKVVADGLAAEYAAYLTLPKLDTTGLSKYFIKKSPAICEIQNVLDGVKKRKWNLQNPMNPSTYRLLSVAVKDISADEAEVASKEYWYLRWWDQHAGQYTYPYRETNQQLYILKKYRDTWKIYQNIRPPPRSSQPLRWNR